jgi:hypothetical protein
MRGAGGSTGSSGFRPLSGRRGSKRQGSTLTPTPTLTLTLTLTRLLVGRLVQVAPGKKVLRMGSGWYHGFAVVAGGCPGSPEKCSGNGECKHGACVCNKGFTGEDCSSVMHLNPLFRNAKKQKPLEVLDEL